MTRFRFRSFAVSALVLAAFTCEAAAQTMVIATDRQGSLMNRVGTAMAKVITDHSKLRAVVRPFAGPDAFMAALDSGELKVAVLTASSTYTEFNGLTKLKKPRKNIRILRAGPNVLRLGFIVHADSDIKQISQIKGRKLTSDFGGHAVLPRSIAAGLSNGGLTWDDVVKVPVTGVVDGVKTVGAGRAEVQLGGGRHAGGARNPRTEAGPLPVLRRRSGQGREDAGDHVSGPQAGPVPQTDSAASPSRIRST